MPNSAGFELAEQNRAGRSLLRPVVKITVPKADPLTPSPTLLMKLGSLIIHYRELVSADGRFLDKTVIDSLEADPEVIAWIKGMGPMLPVMRR